MFSSNTTQTSGGYEISRSLRFNSADGAFLDRTPATASNRRTWTWSAWVKRGLLTTASGQTIFDGAVSATSKRTAILFSSSDRLYFYVQDGPSGNSGTQSTAVYRDASAWYHIVVALDTTQAVSTNRLKFFVNGSQIAMTSDYGSIAQNDELSVNAVGRQTLGNVATVNTEYFNGYMTEVNFIDGQALTPSSFGEYNADTGVWQPKRYAGSYGTNGFYLNFSDNSNTTAATLGADYSGNGNNWTPNNFSVSAGAGNDSLVDSPTSYGTDTGVGGTVRGNYCTLNPINTVGANTFTNGNLDVSIAGGQVNVAIGTLGVSSGKWYWEVVPTSGADSMIGIADASVTASDASWRSANGWTYYADGNKYNNLTGAAYGASYTTSDVIGVALDMDAGTLTFYKNNASQGVAYSVGISGKTISPMLGNGSSGVTQQYTANFGQRPFAYTAPSGFKALNTQNLPTPTIGATPATQAGKFFNTVLYTGNGSTQSVTVGFQPDWVWLKNRGASGDHGLYDVLRGTTNRLVSNSTNAADTISGVTAFNSSGFSLGADYNGSGNTYVAWNWKANGAGVTNTAGSITSTVSANTTSGFSVVTWTQPGSGTYTIGHGLGAAPAMIIMKSTTLTNNWAVYHRSLGFTQYINLNLTGGATADSSVWVAAPTSSVFSQLVNYGTGGTSVAYCFAEVPGYSKFGSYTGNVSTDGTFCFTGFRPAYLLIKRTDITGDWIIWDSKRNTFNALNSILYPNLSNAEATGASVNIDFVSNGFKLRASSSGLSSGNFIFAAFAETPFKFALAR